MEVKLSSNDWMYLGFIIFGLVVLLGGFIYILLRIFFWEFWLRRQAARRRARIQTVFNRAIARARAINGQVKVLNGGGTRLSSYSYSNTLEIPNIDPFVHPPGYRKDSFFM